MTRLLLPVAICGLFFCCGKNSGNEPFWSCDPNTQQLDSAATAGKLTGTWKWEKVRSGGTGEITKADKNTRVTFNSNGTYVVQENSTQLTQGDWDLQSSFGDFFQLSLSASSTYLDGFILFCANKVQFSNSYVDGGDNVFTKMN